MTSPEFDLLVRACGRARNLPLYEAKSVMRIDPAVSKWPGFDEKLFVRLAYQHKVAATALKGLKMMDICLQPEHLHALKHHALQATMLRELILEGAGVITAALDKANIPAIVLKGPASSIQLYSDALTREYTDLDVLINLPVMDAAIPIMSSLGYVAKDYHSLGESNLKNSRLLQKGHHVVFWKTGNPFRVELHDRCGWENELFVRDNIDDVFARAVVLEQEEKTFLSPSLPDHAALVIAHGTHHAWALLHWFLDAAAIVSIADIATQESIRARIQALNMQCQYQLICELSRRLYPIPPQRALELHNDCKAPLDKSVDFALARLGSGARDMNRFMVRFAYSFNYAAPLFGSKKGALLSVLEQFKIPLQDAEAIPLPKPLFFLHLFLRPFFVFSRRFKRFIERRAGAHE